jgi:Immunity protein Imm1
MGSVLLPDDVFSDSMKRVRLGQCQAVWLVRSIGARLPVHGAVRSAARRVSQCPERLGAIREDSVVTGGWTLAWGDEHLTVAVKSRTHLMELLAEAGNDAATSHTMVELVSSSGRGVVTFTASATEPPYFVSRGDGAAGDALVFFYNGHWTEFGTEAAVPLDDAIPAVRQFFETGQRSSAVAWDEV